jgi:cytochrome c-type biogenesis protein CcmH
MTRRDRGWLPWVALAVVVAAALVLGTHRSGTRTAAQRAAAISSEVRCPACSGESAEVSDAPSAKAVRQFVLQGVEAGATKGQIEQQLEDRYGSDILLRPPAAGVAGLVWVLPVAALVVALGGLVLAFRRWHRMTEAEVEVSAADRQRVADAMVEGDGR